MCGGSPAENGCERDSEREKERTSRFVIWCCWVIRDSTIIGVVPLLEGRNGSFNGIQSPYGVKAQEDAEILYVRARLRAEAVCARAQIRGLALL